MIGKLGRSTRRRLCKVADRIEVKGCDLCGVALGGSVPHHFGFRLKKLVGVCGECVDRLDERPLWSGLFDGPAPWQEADRGWFETNPNRRYRLRLPIGQELAAMEARTGNNCPPTPGGRSLAIAVQEREEGLRVREVVFLTKPPEAYSEDEIRLLVPWQSPNVRKAVDYWINRLTPPMGAS